MVPTRSLSKPTPAPCGLSAGTTTVRGAWAWRLAPALASPDSLAVGTSSYAGQHHFVVDCWDAWGGEPGSGAWRLAPAPASLGSRMVPTRSLSKPTPAPCGLSAGTTTVRGAGAWRLAPALASPDSLGGGYEVAMQANTTSLWTAGTPGVANRGSGHGGWHQPQHRWALEWFLRDRFPSQHQLPVDCRLGQPRLVGPGHEVAHQPSHCAMIMTNTSSSQLHLLIGRLGRRAVSLTERRPSRFDTDRVSWHGKGDHRTRTVCCGQKQRYGALPMEGSLASGTRGAGVISPAIDLAIGDFRQGGAVQPLRG